jgi:lysophospholipase L1-like esterase
MKALLQNMLLVSCGIFAAFLIGEGVARIIYTKPWHARLLEAQADMNWRTSVRLNSQGLRDKDYADKKPVHSHRVLMLGDSFTFGSGVADTNVIFPELLERQLHAEYSSKGETIEILNGGIPGSLTHQWVDLLLKVEDSFKPDVIVIVFFLRDGTKTSSRGVFFDLVRKEIESRNAASFFYKHCYLIRLYKDYKDRRYFAEKYSTTLNNAYLGGRQQTEEWENAKRNILKIKAIAEKRKARIGFVVFPILVELNNRYPFKKISDVIIRFATENNIPAHDLLPAFTGKHGADLWVSGYDQHPNPSAHKIAADSIQPFLKYLIEQ